MACRSLSQRRSALITCLGGSLLATLVGASKAAATTYVISTTNVTDNTDDDRRCSLREAVTASNTKQAVHPHATGGPDCAAGNGTGASPDVIQLGSAEYFLNHPLNVTQNLEIRGTDLDATFITANLGGGSDCGDPTLCPDGRAIALSGANTSLTFRQATLRGGSTILFATGILLDCSACPGNGTSTLTVIDARVSDFTDSGIWNQAGKLVVNYSVIQNNAGGFGGGGGIHVDSLVPTGGNELSGTLQMVGTSIIGNSAEGNGGGVFVNGGGNISAIDSCTFSGNFTTRVGGGLYADSPLTPEYVALTHSTFTLNQAQVSGGGVVAGPMDNIRSAALITTGNVAPAAPDIQGGFSTGFSVIGVKDSLWRYEGPLLDLNDIGTNPSLVLGALTPSGGAHKTFVHPLIQGSPAIDFDPGNDPTLGLESPGVDQRGLPRPQDGGTGRGALWDSGAFELQPNELLLGFEALGQWTSAAPLSLNSTRKTQGLFGLNVGGAGYRMLQSARLRTPLSPLTSNVRVDFFVPGNQPNPQWLGAVQMYATCPSANLYNVYFGQVELTGKPVNAFSTLPFTLPSSVRTAFGQQRSDCFFSIAVNTNATPVAPVLDNLRFVP